MNALMPLGMVSEFPSENQTSTTASAGAEDDRKDYFVERDGMRFAGTHLLIDIWGAARLDDPTHIDERLRAAAVATGATILHSHFHHFSPNGGVSGVVVLAESHLHPHLAGARLRGAGHLRLRRLRPAQGDSGDPGGVLALAHRPRRAAPRPRRLRLLHRHHRAARGTHPGPFCCAPSFVGDRAWPPIRG